MLSKSKKSVLRLATILIAAFALLTVQSCKTKTAAMKKAEQTEAAQTVPQTKATFKSLTAKAEVYFGSAGFSVKGTMRMVKDSALMISVQPFLGIEMARILCNQDSVFIVNKYNRKYFSSTYDDIYSKGGLSYQVVQGLLCNLPWGLDKDGVSAFTQDGATSVITTDGPVVSTFLFDADESLVNTTMTNETKQLTLKAAYSDFSAASFGGFYPMAIDVDYKQGKSSLTAQIKLTNAVFDKNSDVSISIPKGYVKSTLDDMLNILPF